jgi:hypothetical protein
MTSHIYYTRSNGRKLADATAKSQDMEIQRSQVIDVIVFFLNCKHEQSSCSRALSLSNKLQWRIIFHQLGYTKTVTEFSLLSILTQSYQKWSYATWLMTYFSQSYQNSHNMSRGLRHQCLTVSTLSMYGISIGTTPNRYSEHAL